HVSNGEDGGTSLEQSWRCRSPRRGADRSDDRYGWTRHPRSASDARAGQRTVKERRGDKRMTERPETATDGRQQPPHGGGGMKARRENRTGAGAEAWTD